MTLAKSHESGNREPASGGLIQHDFAPENDWGTNALSLTNGTSGAEVVKPLFLKGKGHSQDGLPRARVSLAVDSSPQAPSFLATFALHPLSLEGADHVVANDWPDQLLRHLRRRHHRLTGRALIYVMRFAISKGMGNHIHLMLQWHGDAGCLTSAIEAQTGILRSGSSPKHGIAVSPGKGWHIRRKDWREGVDYLLEQQTKHGLRHPASRTLRASPGVTKAHRAAKTPTPLKRRTASQDLHLMAGRGIILTSPKDAAASYPALGAYQTVKRRWQRDPLPRPRVGVNRVTYRHPRGKLATAYIAQSITDPVQALKQLLPGITITSASIRPSEARPPIRNAHTWGRGRQTFSMSCSSSDAMSRSPSVQA